MSDTVLVTGSSRGIGRAIAMRAAEDGYDVVLHCRSRVDEAKQVGSNAVSPLRELFGPICVAATD